MPCIPNERRSTRSAAGLGRQRQGRQRVDGERRRRGARPGGARRGRPHHRRSPPDGRSRAPMLSARCGPSRSVSSPSGRALRATRRRRRPFGHSRRRRRGQGRGLSRSTASRGHRRRFRLVTESAARAAGSRRARRASRVTTATCEPARIQLERLGFPGRVVLFELADTTERSVVVAGLSLGALLAAHLAATYPPSVAALVVLGQRGCDCAPCRPRLPLAFCEVVHPSATASNVAKRGPISVIPRPVGAI